MKKLKHISKDKVKQSNHFLPTEIKCSTQKHSWFDIEQFDYGASKVLETKSIKHTSIRCKQIKITPTNLQKKILLEWIELARLVYNQTVNYLKHNKSIPFISLRPKIKYLFNDNFKNRINKAKLPVHIIDNAIKDVLKARKTAFILLKLKYINHFRLRGRKQNKPTQTIIIDQQDFSKVKNSFYTKALGEIHSSLPISRSNITHDCKLTYNRNQNIFILHSPRDIVITDSTERFNSCGIDPGLKTFLTVYNPEKECIKIMNRDTTKKLSRLVNKKINLLKLKRTRVIKNAILHNNRKIYNNVKELHYKTARLLCKSYNNIYLGKLSTKSIVKGSLTSFDKHFAHALSHFTFSQILENKCNEFGKKLYYVDESYTSKTCGSCGSMYDVKLSRVYSCKSCLQKYDRDMNAARNILIKSE
jgi:IS605 OrfB family transposase